MKLTWKKFDPEATEIFPGMILKVRDTSTGKSPLRINYLVGNVNANLGVCDDCTDFDLKDIVEYSTDYVGELSKHLGPF